jgi:hypothetical protein
MTDVVGSRKSGIPKWDWSKIVEMPPKGVRLKLVAASIVFLAIMFLFDWVLKHTFAQTSPWPGRMWDLLSFGFSAYLIFFLPRQAKSSNTVE